MKQIIGKIILTLIRWKSFFPAEYKIDKMVLVAAPHTAKRDLFIALAAYWNEGVEPTFLVHNKVLRGPFGFFFKWLGGIGVKKDKNTNLVDQMSELYKVRQKMLLLISPEGTEKKAEKWKTGFYHIAQKADVPLSLGWLDYKNRRAGVNGVYYLTGNFEKDMNYIENFYANSHPKYPERYNKNIY